MATIYLSLGSNLGDRHQNLEEAIRRLQNHMVILRKSSIYETEPVGDADQDWFLNLTLKAETTLLPRELLEANQEVERSMGRVKTRINGPRNIDVDILLYGDWEWNDDHLTIPHPRMKERAFVLKPLQETEDDLLIQGQKVETLLRGLACQEVMEWNKCDDLLRDSEFLSYLSLIEEQERDRIYCKHDLEHLLSVAQIACDLGVEEQPVSSREVILTASMLHDIGRWMEYESGIDHAEASAELAEGILKRYRYSEEERRLIVGAIKSHRKKGARMGSLDEILYQADKKSRDCLSCNAKDSCKKYIQQMQINR